MAFEPLAVWRALYDIPINDPRALSITEEDALLDLLIRAHQNRARAAANPAEAGRQRHEDDPEGTRAAMQGLNAWVDEELARVRKRPPEPVPSPAVPRPARPRHV